MQLDHIHEHSNSVLHSSYRCNQCKHGHMLPPQAEVDPEYTDLFICNNCQHQDNITSLAILSSQAISSTLGSFVCIYLFFHQLSLLVSSLNQASTASPITEMILLLLCSIFMVGFVYVLFQAIKGFKHRRGYL